MNLFFNKINDYLTLQIIYYVHYLQKGFFFFYTLIMLFLDARIFRQKRFKLSGFSGNLVLLPEFTEN